MSESSFLLLSSEAVKHFKEIVKSLGVVFGDIGTSPIYTLSVIFLVITPTVANILGVLSLVVWTMFSLVMVQYAWLAMSLGKKGEGGIIVLKEILVPMLKSPGKATFVTAIAFVGTALFFGDGVITPAVSILSAVEGILLIPTFKGLYHSVLILIACVITIALFAYQRKGTERVSIAFGPIMVVWFSTLAISGLILILQKPIVLTALNPWYAIRFMIDNGWTSFLVLTGVILCATGGEALYADMGHLGRKPILHAWYLVFGALILTYLGQGAFLLQYPNARSVLYEMIFHLQSHAYIPFLVLSLIATVIASQAMISGIFSVVYQAITTNIMPIFKIHYTSSKLRSQVYIPMINWCMMIAVLFIILLFQHSHNLAEAYGLAVTGTMTVTGVMMSWIFYIRRSFFKTTLAVTVTGISFLFFLSNLYKIPHGGYWSLVMAFFPLCLIIIYTSGQRKLFRSLQPLPLEMFLDRYQSEYEQSNKIKGSALFFVRDIKTIQSYVDQVMFKNNIMYEDNILISVITRDDPFGVIGFFKGVLAPGLRVFEVHMGYMEVVDIEKILHNAGIDPKVVFYGREEIMTKNLVWKIFSFIKRLSPTFVQFYKLPPTKLHGVVTSVEL